jgi:GNAT superfamily N-acetyltransferase
MDNPAHTSFKGLAFRRAGIQDLEVYLSLRMAMLAELGMLPPESQRTQLLQANRSYFQENLSKETYLAWLAESRGETVAIGGLLLFYRPPNGENMTGLEGYVMNMYTLPGWRGRGIATRLMQIIIEEMRIRQAGRLWLHATPMGRPVYQSNGFTPVNQNLSAESTVEMEIRLQGEPSTRHLPG